MPVAPTYPGVYIEEIPSGVRTITGVATSITALVGRALRGPVNDPIAINNYGDYERIFGGLWGQSAMSYAVRDFFGNGGGQAIIVRLYKGGGPSTITTPEPTQEEIDVHVAAVAVSAAAQAAASSKQAIIDAADTARDEYLKDEYGPLELAAANSVVAAVAAVREAGGSMADMKAAAAAAANVLMPVESTTTTVSTSPKAKIMIGSGSAALNLEAANAGSWGNQLEVIITIPSSPAETTAAVDLGLTNNDTFSLYVTDTTTGNTESFLNVSVVESARQLDGVLKDRSALIRVEGNTLPTTRPAATPNDQTEPVTTLGSDGEILTPTEFTNSGDKKGLYALENADLFNLLCIPPHTIDGEIGTDLISKAAKYAEDRRAFFIIDPPISWIGKDTAKTAMLGGTLGSSKNAAVFFPRLRKPDPLRENQLRDFVPCGAVAGVIARTDSTRGLWKAPAGLDATLKGVPALSVPLTDAENGELNPLGLNCLRAMGPAGRVIWGSRTTQGNDQLASEWKYLSVRRVALYIEESLYRGTHWAVFEPNDEPLWSQIRLNLGAFMHNMFRQGAFQGSSPKDAYFVKCDSETTTQNDINLGIVNILIGFAPLKPAEFVIIKLQQIAGQVAA